MTSAPLADGRLSFVREGVHLVVRLQGKWAIGDAFPSIDGLEQALDTSPTPERVRLDAQSLESWDSSLLVVLRRVEAICSANGIRVDDSQLPPVLREWNDTARRSAEGTLRSPHRASSAPAASLMERVGLRTLQATDSAGVVVAFVVRAALSVLRMPFRRGRTPNRDLATALQDAGAGTFAILSSISLLGGGVLSLLAAQQLERLGASLLAPQLVAIAIARELGALMTGMALVGRLGSAYAGELASMTAAGEVESLRAVGVEPFDLLVGPRLVALTVAGPLLVAYANAFGLLGSVLVGVGVMDLSPGEYLDRTRAGLSLGHAAIGLVKGATFGLVVGLAACYHGLRNLEPSGRIGGAVKAAVTSALLGVVAADAALTFIFKWVRV